MKNSYVAVRAICRNTISVWLRNRSLIAASLIPPIAFLAAGYYAAAAVSHSPVALVNLDRGAEGRRMDEIFHSSDLFRLTDTNPAHAQAMLKSLRVAAVITIPPDFSERVRDNQAVPVNYEINNLNLDFTNDIRRSVPTAITQFYASESAGNPIAVRMQEKNLRREDIQLFQYEVMPVLILTILITGLVNTAVSTAREYELKTIKEILLSPVSNAAIVTGKILAGFVIGIGCGLIELGICLGLGWVHSTRWQYWAIALGVMTLTALLSASTGFAVGSAVKKIQAAHALATNAALPLFFLAGGVGVLAFEPYWLQNIAKVVPIAYANHALQMAMFYGSSDALGRDLAVLVSISLIVTGIAAAILKKSRTHFT